MHASQTPAPESPAGLVARPGELAELLDGALRWRLWSLLAWQDISLRYRRSILGPFWLTLSMGIMVGALGLLYGSLLRIEIGRYLPYLAAGFVVWGFVATSIAEGCGTFLEAESLIKQLKLPLSVYVLRVVCRNVIIALHNVVVFVAVALIFGVWPGWIGWLALVGFALLVLNAVWVALLLGLIAARFRDVTLIVASLLQVVFFLTPVLWQPELLQSRLAFVTFNPFFHVIEVVRAPLLGVAPALASWGVVVGVLVLGWAATLAALARFGRRVAYWI